ncbi:MAG: nucleotidyltransferase domain-containing protein [Magnetococcales bacterium]|nr:nucleotidyltransferase domain-containing protein [Magnetococcales bacterium]MBF0157007.1 nucleotidyltransferase domain-containing protein [Magnetococcales bacterium]
MKTPDPDILNEMVRRIVEVAHPLRIILFGSAARGEMGPDSDLDLLVVMPDGIHRRRTSQALFMALRAVDIPKDIVVVTQRDVIEYGDNPSLVIRPALADGKELYHDGCR